MKFRITSAAANALAIALFCVAYYVGRDTPTFEALFTPSLFILLAAFVTGVMAIARERGKVFASLNVLVAIVLFCVFGLPPMAY